VDQFSEAGGLQAEDFLKDATGLQSTIIAERSTVKKYWIEVHHLLGVLLQGV
jgi:hypothetical protein